MGLEHWESYYRGGALVSCPVGPEPGYTHELRDAWMEFYSPLASGARIVDIGTGNGAVALIAKEKAAALGRAFEIHGVDLARIDPPRDVPGGAALFDGIHFHPGIRAESLPFEAATVDALGGQYALEYTDVPRALAEAFRIFKAGRALPVHPAPQRLGHRAQCPRLAHRCGLRPGRVEGPAQVPPFLRTRARDALQGADGLAGPGGACCRAQAKN